MSARRTAKQQSVLLFSGGRDSTLAAIRLSRIVERLILVTVTSGHLIGIDAVRRRLDELKRHLSADTRWINMVQPPAMPSDRLFQAATCLPCHRSYTAIGALVAAQLGAKSLAFGYTRYQSEWLEQTPEATECLARLLARRGINLLLPVYDIKSKEDAIAELKRYGLSTVALEQKCLQQQFNTKLERSKIKSEIAVWEQALILTLDALLGLPVQTITDTTLKRLEPV